MIQIGTQLSLFTGEAVQTYPEPKDNFPVSETPGYRVEHDAMVCSTNELLSVVIGGKNGEKLSKMVIKQFGDIHKIALAQIEEIASVEGVTRPTALRIKAAVSLGRRWREEIPETTATIHSPKESAEFFYPKMCFQEQEFLFVMLLDTRTHVIDVVEVYKGSLNASMVRVGEIFKVAIRINAASIIIAHNHPSGDTTPSPDDITMTRATVQAGKLIDIDVLDHLVIGNHTFTSLKERGLGFS